MGSGGSKSGSKKTASTVSNNNQDTAKGIKAGNVVEARINNDKVHESWNGQELEQGTNRTVRGSSVQNDEARANVKVPPSPETPSLSETSRTSERTLTGAEFSNDDQSGQNRNNTGIHKDETLEENDVRADAERDVKRIDVDVVDAAVFLGVDVDGIEEIHLVDDMLQAPLVKTLSASVVTSSGHAYNMRHKSRGRAVVINNKDFSGSSSRKGTDVDAIKLCNRLKNTLSFDVQMSTNCTCKQMLEIFAEAASCDYTDADCFVGAILTHGGNDGYIHGTDGEMDQNRIFELFCEENCPSLAGKPKIFFIQACRGKKYDPGVNLKVGQSAPEMPNDNRFHSNMVAKVEIMDEEVSNDYLVCPEADFLISFSTVAGFFSFRNSFLGSWYVQALVKAIDECGTTQEFLKVLTRVNKIVAYSDKFMSKTGDKATTGKKQSPSFSSTLTRNLFFHRK